jgi:hypothetical protein
VRSSPRPPASHPPSQRSARRRATSLLIAPSSFTGEPSSSHASVGLFLTRASSLRARLHDARTSHEGVRVGLLLFSPHRHRIQTRARSVLADLEANRIRRDPFDGRLPARSSRNLRFRAGVRDRPARRESVPASEDASLPAFTCSPHDFADSAGAFRGSRRRLATSGSTFFIKTRFPASGPGTSSLSKRPSGEPFLPGVDPSPRVFDFELIEVDFSPPSRTTAQSNRQ